MFMYSSTRFGHPHAHHQELNCGSSLWFLLLECSDSSAVGRDRAGRLDHEHLNQITCIELDYQFKCCAVLFWFITYCYMAVR